MPEHLPNECEILGSLLNSAIKPKPKSRTYFNPLGNYTSPGAQICGKVEIRPALARSQTWTSHVDSSSSPASLCPQLLPL